MHTYTRARIRYTLTILLFTFSPSLDHSLSVRSFSVCARTIYMFYRVQVHRAANGACNVHARRIDVRRGRAARRRTSLEACRTIYYRSTAIPPPSLAVARYTSTALSIRKWYVSARGTRTFHRPLSHPFSAIRCSLLVPNLALVHPSCFNLPHSSPLSLSLSLFLSRFLSLSLSLSLSFLSGTRAHGRENNK